VFCPQFYEEYRPFPKLAPLVRELSWTNNLIIFSKTKSIEEKEFYINFAGLKKHPPNLFHALFKMIQEDFVLQKLLPHFFKYIP
jgi:hypothetical protein